MQSGSDAVDIVSDAIICVTNEMALDAVFKTLPFWESKIPHRALWIESISSTPSGRYVAEALLDIAIEQAWVVENKNTLTFEYSSQKRPDCRPTSKIHPQARSDPFVQLAERCARYLASFLEGSISGLEIFFPKGDLSLWEEVHSNSVIMSRYGELVANCAQKLISKDSRVLELGAGTGATTHRLLTKLSHGAISDYFYTDVGFEFLRKAGQRFNMHEFMRFGRLDINKSFVSQEILHNYFDIILATNTLHIATDLPHIAIEIAKALRPGGFLIAGEGAPKPGERWRGEVIFGFLDGWATAPIDNKWRSKSVFLSLGAWKEILCEAKLIIDDNSSNWSGSGGVFVAQKQHD